MSHAFEDDLIGQRHMQGSKTKGWRLPWRPCWHAYRRFYRRLFYV